MSASEEPPPPSIVLTETTPPLFSLAADVFMDCPLGLRIYK